LLSLLRASLSERQGFLEPSSFKGFAGIKSRLILKGLAIGRARVRKGSKVMLILWHVRHYTVLLS
jgi:hypothetical protein